VTAPAPIGVIAHYNVLERLEPAGPGDLYRARDTRYGRTVALRLLPASATADAAIKATLVDQARALMQLSHPNAITLFDVGEHDGRVYLAFEFLKGQSLRGEIAGRQMNVRRAVEIAIQMANAIAEAHAAGFLHGGLSPESVVITARGHAKIPAFELAAHAGFVDADGRSRLLDYDAPEEARGERPDERADVYSVGAVLYEMLTTRRPMHRGAAAPGGSNPHVPPELDQVVLKAVSPNPASRQQTAATLAAELRAVVPIIDAREDAEATSVAEKASRSPAHIGQTGLLPRPIIVVLIVFAVLAALVVWLTRS
jgi:eukaryotic-like serine/threonine-protein kinase